MNAAFSILQKLKNQFLQGVADKSVYHVAFAPFAFTMTSDDFFFLKNAALTGDEGRKYLREQSEFAIVANSVLQRPHVWRVDSDNLLYTAYKDVLENALTLDPSEIKTGEKSRFRRAERVLFTNNKDSAKYKAYKKYAGMAAEAESKLIDHTNSRSSIAENETAALARWALELQTLTTQKEELEIEWYARGFKRSIELAKSEYEEIVVDKDRFIKKWLDAKNIKLGSPNWLTDTFGVDFLATTCIPNSICEPGAPIWKKISLARKEIAELTRSFAQEVPPEVVTEFGDLQPELDAITFEYCMVDIVRPWFDESIITSRMWKYADKRAPRLSSGDNSMSGRVPAYPVKIILAKNIDLVFTPNAPVNEDIKTQLKDGNRLFFGPLLLKTIPANLPEGKITGFRVQQASNPELAVLTEVGLVGVDKRPETNAGKRLEMIQSLHRRPQSELRRQVGMKSGPAKTMRQPPNVAKPVIPVPEVKATPEATPAMAPEPTSSSNLWGWLKFPLKLLGWLKSLIGLSPPPAEPGLGAAPQTVTFVGRVYSSDSHPVPVAEIQIMNMVTATTQSVLSLENGTYTFHDVDSGSYEFKVRKTGYVTQEKRVVDARGNSTQDFLLELQPVPTESFQVIGVICKKLPRLPNPWPGGAYI